MALSRKTSALIIAAVFVGILGGLIIASNFEWTQTTLASQDDEGGELTPEAVHSPQTTADTRSLAQAINDLYAGTVEGVSPSVVTITSERRVEMRSPFADFFGRDDFFRRFFGFDAPPEYNEYIQNVLGSGVIVRADGHIITNYHVIKDAQEVRVMIGKQEYNAKIVGSDPRTDIGILKIEDNGKDFPVVRFGDSDKLRIGEVVLAFGTPFDPGLDRTVTRGIVSAKGRGILIQGSEQYVAQNFIQTDAAINPGNSGGPLVNLYGELVGINTAIVGQANVGIGFAIPVNTAKWVMEQILETGEVTRGYLGILPKTVDNNLAKAYGLDEPKGVLVEEVTEDTPADKAGLKPEDIILEIDGTEVNDDNQLRSVIATIPPETKISIRILRGGRELELSATLTKRPPDEALAQSEPSQARTTSILGLTVRNLSSELARQYGYEGDEGVFISSVQPGSAAAREGIPENGLLREVNRVRVTSVQELENEIDKVKPGDVVLFRIKYRGSNSFFALEMPNR